MSVCGCVTLSHSLPKLLTHKPTHFFTHASTHTFPTLRALNAMTFNTPVIAALQAISTKDSKHDRILRDIYSYGIRGRMLRCIQSFLSVRTFRVRIGCNFYHALYSRGRCSARRRPQRHALRENKFSRTIDTSVFILLIVC